MEYKRFNLCSTPFGIIGILTDADAHLMTDTGGAQRLSASSEFSHTPNGFCGRKMLVLNAFRHHRNSHGANCPAMPTSSMCSTPFGIIGILTGWHIRGDSRL